MALGSFLRALGLSSPRDRARLWPIHHVLGCALWEGAISETSACHARLSSRRHPHRLAPVSMPAMEPGALLAGKYRLLRLIGEGGMGAVWAATNELTHRNFALKLIAGE